MNAKTVHASLTQLAQFFGNAHIDRRQAYQDRLIKEDWDETIFSAAIDYLIETEEYKGLPPYSHIVKAYENKAQLMTPGGRLGYWDFVADWNAGLSADALWHKHPKFYLPHKRAREKAQPFDHADPQLGLL